MLKGWRRHLAALVALAAGGMLVVWLGVIDIRASSGHWKITDWFLHWAMRSSVRTAALVVEPPSLDNPAFLPLAANHYEIACATCHGSPAVEQSSVMLRMLPPPPNLKTVVGQWTDAELHEIVTHGVRYTGMPAWPAIDRSDEVWAMVAFLRRYPELDAPEYKRLAGFEATTSKDIDERLVACEGCHASARLTTGSLIPDLGGQPEAYLVQSLQAFADDKRPSGVMQTAVSGLDATQFVALAKHYAQQRKVAKVSSIPAPKLVAEGDVLRKIPACDTCHDSPGINPAFPNLHGQSAAYLENQLRLFMSGNRGGGAYSELMRRSVENLTAEEAGSLARYYGR